MVQKIIFLDGEGFRGHREALQSLFVKFVLVAKTSISHSLARQRSSNIVQGFAAQSLPIGNILKFSNDSQLRNNENKLK